MLRFLLLLIGLTSMSAQTDNLPIITKRVETTAIAVPNDLTNNLLQSYGDILNKAVSKINEAIVKSDGCNTHSRSTVVKIFNNEANRMNISFQSAEAAARKVFQDCGMIDGATVSNDPWIVAVVNTATKLNRMAILIHPLAAYTKYEGFQREISFLIAGRKRIKIDNVLSNGLKDHLLIWKTPLKVDITLMPICLPSSMDFLADCRLVTWLDPERRKGKVVSDVNIVKDKECNGGSTVCVTSSECIPGESAVHCSLPSSRRVFLGFPNDNTCKKSQVLTLAYPNLNWILEQGLSK